MNVTNNETRPAPGSRPCGVASGGTRLAIAAVALAAWATPAQAKTLRAMVTPAGSTAQQTWYVVEADSEEGLVLSAAESGSGQKRLAADKVSSVAFDPPEGWVEANEAFNREQYEDAAKRFAKLADDYEGLAGWEDSYGARAKFLQIESLRLAGEFEALATQMDRLKRKPVRLGPAYQSQLELSRAWGYAGRKAWNALRQTVSGYEATKAGGDSNPGAVPFRELPAGEFVQVAYLRGMLEESEGNAKAALGDFSRAVMLSFGAEKAIARRALEAALDILIKHPELDENPALQGEGYALAQVFTTNFNDQKLPEAYGRFRDPPPKEEGETSVHEEAAKDAVEEADAEAAAEVEAEA